MHFGVPRFQFRARLVPEGVTSHVTTLEAPLNWVCFVAERRRAKRFPGRVNTVESGRDLLPKRGRKTMKKLFLTALLSAAMVPLTYAQSTNAGQSGQAG